MFDLRTRYYDTNDLNDKNIQQVREPGCLEAGEERE